MEHATEVGLDWIYRDPRGPTSPQRAQFVLLIDCRARDAYIIYIYRVRPLDP